MPPIEGQALPETPRFSEWAATTLKFVKDRKKLKRPEQLTYKFQGRNFRLTDVHGTVVTKLIA